MIPLPNAAFTLQLSEYEANGYVFLLITFAGIALFLPSWFLHDWYLARRRIRRSTISVSYEPPSGITPAEMRYLFAGLPLDRALASTLVNLIQGSYIHALKRGDTKIYLHGPKVSKSLKPHENAVLSAIPVGGASFDELLFTLGKGGASKSYSDGVHDSLHEQSLISGKQVNTFFMSTLKVASALLVAFVWWPLSVFSFLHVLGASASDFSVLSYFTKTGAIATIIAATPVLFMSLFIMKYRAQLLGRRWMSTPKLTRLWPQVVGYKEFVRLTERGNLTYTSPELKKRTETEVLPYAIAIGYTANWRDIVS